MPILNKYLINILVYSDSYILKKIYEIHNNKKLIKTKSNIKNSENDSDKNNNKIKLLKKMLLKDLQELSNKKNIDIMKDGTKNNKIYKTKTELYNELKNLI